MAGTLSIETGFRCNNRCGFCYQLGWRSGGNVRDPDFATLARKLEWGRENGYDSVGFSGGEPTIRSDFLDLVRLASKLGYRRISITTNGRRFSNRSFAAAMLDAGVNSIGWSLHGPTPEIHDSLVRRNGAFRQLILGIRNVAEISRETGVHVDQNLFTLVNKYNQDHLSAIGRLGLDNGIKLSILQPLIYSKGNLSSASEYALELEKLIASIRRTAADAKRHGWFVKLFNLPVCLFADMLDAFEHQRVPVDVFRLQESAVAGETQSPGGDGYVRLDRCADCVLGSFCLGLHQSLLPQDILVDMILTGMRRGKYDWLSGLELFRSDSLSKLLLALRTERPDARIKVYYGGESVAGDRFVEGILRGGAVELCLVLHEPETSGNDMLAMTGGNAARLALVTSSPLLTRQSFMRLSLAVAYRNRPDFPSDEVLRRFAALGVRTLEVHFPSDFKDPEVFEAVKSARLLMRWLRAGGRDLRLVLPEGRMGSTWFRLAAGLHSTVFNVAQHHAFHFFAGPGGAWISMSVPPSVQAGSRGTIDNPPVLKGIVGSPINAAMLDQMRAG